MGAILTEPPEKRFDYFDHWKEIAENDSPGSAGLSSDSHEVTEVGLVPWERRRSAEAYFLGYAWADTAAPWLLHRVNPAQHPERPWLRAAKVTTSSHILVANTDNDNNEPYVESDLVSGLYQTQYKWAKLAVTYRAWRCRFLEDGPDEWRRNCVFDAETDVQALSADGASQLTFFEGGGGTEPTAGTTKFPAPVSVLLSKKKLVISALSFPWEYFSSDPDVFTPDKIDACLGHINHDVWLGTYPKFTALFKGYKVQVFPFPVPSVDLEEPVRGVNLQLEFELFDPDNRKSDTYRGHVLFPSRLSSKFFGASKDGAAPGAGTPTNLMLPVADFDDIFLHVGA